MSSDPRAWIAALRGSHERLSGLVGPLTAGELTRASYASEWTIAKVLSHLGSGAEIAKLTLTAALPGGPGAPDRSLFPPVWAAWDAKSPQEAASDSLAADEAVISMLERLSDAELTGISVGFLGVRLGAVGLLRVWLGEHAMHTWDIAVALSPSATVADDAVALLAADLPMLAGRLARPPARPFAARLRGAGPDVDLLLEAGEEVSLTRWPGDRPATPPPPGAITLPAEALLRLVYGRLDPAHTPAAEVVGDADLDRLRAVFPGL